MQEHNPVIERTCGYVHNSVLVCTTQIACASRMSVHKFVYLEAFGDIAWSHFARVRVI